MFSLIEGQHVVEALFAVLTETCVSPENPRTRAAAGDRSIIRPRTKGPRSVDDHDHRMPIALVRYRHLRAERQSAVGGGESFAILMFLTAGGWATAFNGIDRGNPDLIRRRTSEITGRKLTG